MRWNYRCPSPASAPRPDNRLATHSEPHTGKGFNISILGGFDDCLVPLESITSEDYLRDTAVWAHREVLTPPCRFSRGMNGFGPIIASFALPASELHVAPRPVSCSFDTIRGAYAWSWPHAHEADFIGVEDCRPLTRRRNKLCAGEVRLASKFYVGDSNGGYMMWFGRLGNCGIPRNNFIAMNGAAGDRHPLCQMGRNFSPHWRQGRCRFSLCRVALPRFGTSRTRTQRHRRSSQRTALDATSLHDCIGAHGCSARADPKKMEPEPGHFSELVAHRHAERRRTARSAGSGR